MGDWDFLYEMNERGYSSDEIADAAGAGMAGRFNLPQRVRLLSTHSQDRASLGH